MDLILQLIEWSESFVSLTAAHKHKPRESKFKHRKDNLLAKFVCSLLMFRCSVDREDVGGVLKALFVVFYLAFHLPV